MPLISVLMPAYNAERFLPQTMDSVLNQTLGDFEFIIIDDGSKDRTLDVLKPYAEKDARIRLVSRANTGLVVALNEMLAMAQGEFLARIDADDVCAPDRFEKQIERMRAEPELVALGSCAAAMDEDGDLLGELDVPLTHEQIEQAHLAGISSIHHPAVMMRADAVRRVGGYRDLVPCEDFDLWLRLGEVGRLANLPERLISKRLLSGSIVATHLDRQRGRLAEILNDTWKRRGLPGKPQLPPPEISSRYDQLDQWGWMALRGGHVRTSRKYALRLMKHRPLAMRSWRLMYCALRGR